MGKACRAAALCLSAALLAGAAGCGRDAQPAASAQRPSVSRTYEASDDVLYNPLTGFAPEADDPDAVGEHTLVYIEVLWKDIEPEEGVYDFTLLEEKNNLEQWRQEGKHAVLRFMCDKPSEEEHMDIPQWLYEKTGDGSFYAYDESHKGYSPDYSNPVFIAAHEKAIEVLGEALGRDTFVSYVELGSLGHWGEWHVNYDEGIVRIPKEAVREQYVTPYLTAFPQAKMLMRRPFNTAAKYGFGLYDDTAGHPESTADWLDWIENGGDYSQAQETDALTPMPDAWQTAPIGGELNSDLTMQYMLTDGLQTTLQLLQASHTTFLGPNCPTGRSERSGEGCEEGIAAVHNTLGYRLRIAEAVYYPANGEEPPACRLEWANDGIAPMYWDWPVYLYILDAAGQVTGRYPVDLETTSLLPGKTYETLTELDGAALGEGASLCLGIEDPMTGRPAVSFGMQTETVDGMARLFAF